MVKRESREEIIEDIWERCRLEREIDRDTAYLYFKAVEALKNEGDMQAHVAYDYLVMPPQTDGMRPPPWSPNAKPSIEWPTLEKWASNIHHNTWGSEGLGARLKARVVLLRMQGEKGR